MSPTTPPRSGPETPRNACTGRHGAKSHDFSRKGCFFCFEGSVPQNAAHALFREGVYFIFLPSNTFTAATSLDAVTTTNNNNTFSNYFFLTPVTLRRMADQEKEASLHLKRIGGGCLREEQCRDPSSANDQPPTHLPPPTDSCIKEGLAGHGNPAATISESSGASTTVSGGLVTLLSASTDTNLFVGFLPPTISDDDLAALFDRFGTVVSAKVMRHLKSGKSKGYGFVALRDRDPTTTPLPPSATAASPNMEAADRALSAALNHNDDGLDQSHDPRSTATVNLVTNRAAGDAIAAMSGYEWHGKRLIVKIATTVEPERKPRLVDDASFVQLVRDEESASSPNCNNLVVSSKPTDDRDAAAGTADGPGRRGGGDNRVLESTVLPCTGQSSGDDSEQTIPRGLNEAVAARAPLHTLPKLHVHGFPPTWTEVQLMQFFGMFGPVVHAQIFGGVHPQPMNAAPAGQNTDEREGHSSPSSATRPKLGGRRFTPITAWVFCPSIAVASNMAQRAHGLRISGSPHALFVDISKGSFASADLTKPTTANSRRHGGRNEEADDHHTRRSRPLQAPPRGSAEGQPPSDSLSSSATLAMSTIARERSPPPRAVVVQPPPPRPSQPQATMSLSNRGDSFLRCSSTAGSGNAMTPPPPHHSQLVDDGSWDAAGRGSATMSVPSSSVTDPPRWGSYGVTSDPHNATLALPLAVQMPTSAPATHVTLSSRPAPVAPSVIQRLVPQGWSPVSLDASGSPGATMMMHPTPTVPPPAIRVGVRGSFAASATAAMTFPQATNPFAESSHSARMPFTGQPHQPLPLAPPFAQWTMLPSAAAVGSERRGGHFHQDPPLFSGRSAAPLLVLGPTARGPRQPPSHASQRSFVHVGLPTSNSHRVVVHGVVVGDEISQCEAAVHRLLSPFGGVHHVRYRADGTVTAVFEDGRAAIAAAKAHPRFVSLES